MCEYISLIVNFTIFFREGKIKGLNKYKNSYQEHVTLIFYVILKLNSTIHNSLFINQEVLYIYYFKQLKK